MLYNTVQYSGPLPPAEPSVVSSGSQWIGQMLLDLLTRITAHPSMLAVQETDAGGGETVAPHNHSPASIPWLVQGKDWWKPTDAVHYAGRQSNSFMLFTLALSVPHAAVAGIKKLERFVEIL